MPVGTRTSTGAPGFAIAAASSSAFWIAVVASAGEGAAEYGASVIERELAEGRAAGRSVMISSGVSTSPGVNRRKRTAEYAVTFSHWASCGNPAASGDHPPEDGTST